MVHPETDLILYSVVFGDQYEYMTGCMTNSLKRNMPGVEHVVRKIAPAGGSQFVPAHVTDNNAKLWMWSDFVSSQPDDARVMLCDVDLLILKDVRSVFDDGFDIAYTVRDARVPFNSGVMFIRVNDRSRLFVHEWARASQRIVDMGRRAEFYIKDCVGGNQKAFRDTKRICVEWDDPPYIVPIPCEIWNCEQESYSKFSEETRVLHVKGWLREAALHNVPQHLVPDNCAALLPICREYGY